jgi:hypothetical protein
MSENFWKPGLVSVGGASAWYALRGNGQHLGIYFVVADVHGPFDTEADCRAWCERENAPAVVEIRP